MNSLKGTGRLVRLILRRDRIKLPVWILIIVGLIASTLPTYLTTYETLESRQLYASSTATSMVTRLLGGAITGPSLGEITIIETFLFLAVLAALMNVFLIVRHTRQNEEFGRSEIIASMAVGRHSALTAVLLVALLANVLVALGLFGSLVGAGLPVSGSLAYGVVIGLVGLVFAAITAVTVQLSENTRGASGMAGLVLGVSALIRGVGDALGKVSHDGLSAQSHWISWLSPLGWATNLQPFAAERWWVVVMFFTIVVAMVSTAYILLSKRDLGAGLVQSRLGRLHAKPALLKPLGLHWRLHKTAFIAWGVSLISVGVIIGAVAHEFTRMIDENDQFREILEAMGGSGTAAELMLGATFAIMSLAAAGFVLQMLLRMKHEENEGRLELTLSGRLSRRRWMLRYIVFSYAGGAAIFILTGLAAGLTYGLVSGGVADNTLGMLKAASVYLPAILTLAGLSAMAFALMPRFAAAISWGLLGFCVFVGQFGTFLNLPSVVLGLSPFTHIPTLPTETIIWTPLVLLSAIGLLLLAVSTTGFRHRDILTD